MTNAGCALEILSNIGIFDRIECGWVRCYGSCLVEQVSGARDARLRADRINNSCISYGFR